MLRGWSGASGAGLRPESFLIEAKTCASETAQEVATCGRVELEVRRLLQAWRLARVEQRKKVATCGRVELEVRRLLQARRLARVRRRKR